MKLINLLDTGLVPDFIIRMGIRTLLKQRLKQEDKGDPEKQHQAMSQLIAHLKQSPIAVNVTDANDQHYELAPSFFERVLGKRLKYSSGYWPDEVTPGTEHELLDQSEESMLKLTCERADIQDGLRILDLGCGWGSLSLWIAECYPNCTVVGVSNSASQRHYIERVAIARGLKNLTVITADMNQFTTTETFDRIVSIEMFEHMRNYQELLKRVSSWMVPDGKLFVHIFSHKEFAYLYEDKDESDWMTRYFFSGGIMPSNHLLLKFTDDVQVDRFWSVSGRHYQRTCAAWRQKMDRQGVAVKQELANVYGQDQVRRWWTYWRVFFMACEELFGYQGGSEWQVSHYRFVRARGSAGHATN